MPTQLIDMDALKGESIEGVVALPIELLGDLCIRIFLKKTIHRCQGLGGSQAILLQTVEEVAL